MGRYVCVSPYVPHVGIDHAGGEYLYRVLCRLHSLGWAVTLVAPGTVANQSAAGRAPEWLDLRFSAASSDAPRLRQWIRLLLQGTVEPLPKEWRRGLDEGTWGIIRSADIVDFQWAQSVIYARMVRSVVPKGKLIATDHDVLTLTVLREIRHGGLRRKFRGLAILLSTAQAEIRGLNACRRVYVFKREDARALRRGGVKSDLEVTPAFFEGRRTGSPSPNPLSRRLLFVGALQRRENQDALRWLTHTIFPVIKTLWPDAVLRVAGAHPPQWLRNIPDVEVTGFLPDLDAAYHDVLAVVAPLRLGGGIKFKVLQALAYGFPVVGTATAFEGIEEGYGMEAHSLIVANETEAFAKAVSSIISDPEQHISAACSVADELSNRASFDSAIEAQIAGYRGEESTTL